ncbi:MAG: hypothetical protein H7Y30_10875 [Pyrinomonadaceae bacterium]|nr:hypothetical protein [Pyrinomonadaceae bacterium]
MMSAEFTSPTDFWPHFVEHYLGQRPIVIKQFYARPLTTAEEVFKGLLTASEQFRAGGHRGAIKFHTERSLKYDEVTEKHFPEPDDNSLDGYAERISRSLNGRRFFVSFDRYQTCDARIYLRVREFLRGLYETTGIPASSSTAVIVFGNYEKTPFGLHRDNAGNFTFVLDGRKRILAWPDEYFSGREDVLYSLDYEPFRDDAIVLEGQSGDLLYWPPNYWHIAESVGGFPLTLSVGNFSPENDASAKFFKKLSRSIEQRVRGAVGAGLYPLNPNQLQESADQLPLLAGQLSTALREASQDTQLAQSLRIAWLNRMSSFGFQAVPPPLPQSALADEDVCCVDTHYPILWLHADNEFVCSANGHAFSITAHPIVLQLLEQLNKGESCRIKCLLDKYAGTALVNNVEVAVTREDLRSIMEKLWSLRALTRTAQPHASVSTS